MHMKRGTKQPIHSLFHQGPRPWRTDHPSRFPRFALKSRWIPVSNISTTNEILPRQGAIAADLNGDRDAQAKICQEHAIEALA